LVATAATEEVTLRWNASSNATSYNVKQATHSGGPYTLIANVATTNFTNTDMVGRTTYYYVVSAENSLAGESANSAQVSAAPTVNVPLPWMTQDMGAVGVWGGAGLTNSVFTVTGSGNDIWNAADAFRFVYVATNSTNCTIIARVASLQNIDPWSKAGVMIRDSLDPGAANAFIAVTPGSGVTFQYRSSDGGSCANNNTTGLSAPYWVKLAQSGTTFTGYCSPDGVTWTVLGSATLTNVSTAYIGLAVTSHNNSSLCPATFDNVNCPGWSPTPLAVTALAVSGSQVNLTWNPVSNAISYDVKRSTSSGGTYVIIATGVTTTNYTDLGVSVSAGCYYIVSAIVRNGQTTNGPVAALSFPDLAGAIIGTPGSWNNDGGTIANVFDSNPATFFDGPDGSGDWVGLDFGAGVSNVITQINYCPRSGFESRMIAGVFQGANQAGFSDAVALATVGAQPATGVFTTADVGNASAFRYVRYLSPSGGFCNVAELQFYGCLFSIPVPPPASLGAFVLSSSQVSLVWRASSNATGYNLKRALASGGPYTIIASGVTTTNYTDSGLNSGTTYYYVVSALNSTGQSANSGRISATPVNLPQPRIVAACMAGGSLVFSGTNGSAGGSYTIWSTTNVATPFANWTQVGGGSFDGSGNFSATNLINASQTRQFYLLRQP
jgi:fibronectin type 3 domain-containing protein